MKWVFLRLIFIILSVSQVVYAANVTNRIDGVGPKQDPIKPVFCIKHDSGLVTAVEPGKTLDGNKASGDPQRVQGALRFGGCNEANTYLGWVGFRVNDQHDNKFLSYSPFEGVHISYINPAIDVNGVISGKVSYTPIAANLNLLSKPAQLNSHWDFVGINLSGLEFSKVIDPVAVPNLSEADKANDKSDLNETRAFLNAGINTVRVPVSWGYLQLDGAGKGEIYADYYDSYVRPLLQSLTKSGVYTIVDLHAYMRYSTFGKEYSGCFGSAPCPDGKLIETAEPFVDIWAKLYAKIAADPLIDQQFIMLDLMNEPVDVPGKSVFTFQVEAIKKLRSLGFKGKILVEGNAWTGLHSWTTHSWSEGGTTYTNATLFSRKNFEEAGVNLDNILINVHQYLDHDSSGTHDQCIAQIEPAKLNAFVDYLKQDKLKAIVTEFGAGRDSQSCKEPLKKFMTYLKDNSAKNKEYGFVGWTVWSTGHGWGDYNLRVTPTSYQMNVLKEYLQPLS